MSEAAEFDYEGAKLGMWLFLFTEFMLFGALFMLYGGSRVLNPEQFHAASRELDAGLGVANTMVLLTGSLFIASALSALQGGRRRAARNLTALTVLCGAVFLAVKGFEWAAHFRHGFYPNGPALKGAPPGRALFAGLYYLMTGLHGLHVLAGMALLSVLWFWLGSGRARPDHFIALENSALYWHLVDIIWIFLLPLFYLAA
ncbi:MAG: cytochrome c oxidase subunit 3 family protein [Elusimicrobia bacterium]|nr:cytochrome c oxidase subunit 3 family protein [Elusimicrobiota bacterium]